MKKILVIQTASIGDVILMTPVLEKLHHLFPQAGIDVLVKDGNQGLFQPHAFIRQVLIWHKKTHKTRNLLALLFLIRREKYNLVVNCQRFFSSGLLTAFSGAGVTSGFRKNPLSCLFTHTSKHIIRKGNLHETGRNLSLLDFLDTERAYPVRLYPSAAHFAKVSQFKTQAYVCISPASLWYTKQYPEEKWVDFLDQIGEDLQVYLLGAEADRSLCDRIIARTKHEKMMNLCGKLNLLESAALMRHSLMNYVNDSAPMHLASAMDAPVAAVFCSTVPRFGFGPLSGRSHVIEAQSVLKCRPCGLHGYVRCPEGHFRCAIDIDTQQLLLCLQDPN